MITKDGKVLLAKRKNSHGEGEYSFPGGHLEYGELFEACAKRETKEETGINIANIKFQYLANIKKYGETHYVHIGLTADWEQGNPEILEPEKSGPWEWYELNNLPSPIFESCRLAVEAEVTGQKMFDS